MTDHRQGLVASLTRNTPLFIFSKCPPTDICDGPSFPRWSFLHSRYGCQRPYLLGSLTFSKCPLTDIHNGLSCTTVKMVRDLFPMGLHTFSKCHTTDIDDGPSLSRRYVLIIRHNCQRLSFWGSPNKHCWCKIWWTPWRFVILMTGRHLVHRVSLLLQRCVDKGRHDW